MGTKENPFAGEAHFIGVCGTAMAALACMLRERGWRVGGSDAAAYPPMSDILAAHGITVKIGYRPEHLPAAPDLVVVGNVAARDNPEVIAAEARGLRLASLPETLWREFLAASPRRLVVAGTHGKTTTASLAAWLLHAAGRDPSFLIGGLVRDFGANYRLGGGGDFVLEGDEYNTAFFDRRAKFHHYRPTHLLLTSLEMDHVDIFADVGAIEREFRDLIAAMPAAGVVVAAAGAERLAPLLTAAPCRVVTYGEEPEACCRLLAREPAGRVSRLAVRLPDGDEWRLECAAIGRHNAVNAVGVLALARELGLGREACAAALSTFGGVKRRQEVIAERGDTVYISDFAHHPTAVRLTLEALRDHWPGRRLMAVFEPRTATSRRNLFQAELATAFAAADEVLVAPVYRGERLAPEDRLDTARLAADIRARGIPARACAAVAEIRRELLSVSAGPRLAVLMSTGDFDGLYTRIAAVAADEIHLDR
ncbi:MAG: UDP-N-acetylmuramate:L-alanyl-gamma-D-glutamyl-meso-diaminopimelate ligase [Deltaproteobacteria bacterium]|nr:UDP-N-acetylmuramate:L-alanyl-gamma-D-glutamyl-meso-diaminopimelate ligase [Candidatus Anaeroferrophillacea bacterium]